MTETQDLGTQDNPVYFRWFRDKDDKPDWGKILLMLGLTVVSGYLAAKSQRWGSEARNPVTEFKMGVAQKEIRIGLSLQRIGKEVEERGWERYEGLRHD
jgi:hypothetical protein